MYFWGVVAIGLEMDEMNKSSEFRRILSSSIQG